MTLSVSNQASPIGSKLVIETVANATSRNSVTGASGILYLIDIDNTGNTDNACYLKIYDNASPTVGTTSPDYVVRIPISQRRSIAIPDGLNFNNLSFAVVTTGGTAGTTNPTNPVIVKMVTT